MTNYPGSKRNIRMNVSISISTSYEMESWKHLEVSQKLTGVGLSKMCKAFTIGRKRDKILSLTSCLISSISIHICTRRGNICLIICQWFENFLKEIWFLEKKGTYFKQCFTRRMAHFLHLDYIISFRIGLIVKMVLVAARRLNGFPSWNKPVVLSGTCWGKFSQPTVLSSSLCIFI